MRAAVLGHPIAHSLSPVLHRAAYAALGLRGWRYDAVDVDGDALPAMMAALDSSWAGLSLTMPLKTDVLALLGQVSDLARTVESVNTVVPVIVPAESTGEGARMVWRGENTDVHGVLAALWEVGVERASSAAVLGAGATAASALAALAALGVAEPVVYARSGRRAPTLERVAARLRVSPRRAPWPSEAAAVAELVAFDVVVATVPAGASDQLAALVAAGPRPVAALIDVVYDPRPTPLVAAWSARGGTAMDGTRMLLHQAGQQVQLMTGLAAPVEEMSSALDAALKTG